MLEIRNLHASVEGKEILKGVDLSIGDGEVHALMGPNGSGKSTLCHVLVGNPQFTVTEGTITFNGKDLLAMPADVRACEGLFMSFQTPVEIPGVSMVNFLRAAADASSRLCVSAAILRLSSPACSFRLLISASLEAACSLIAISSRPRSSARSDCSFSFAAASLCCAVFV